ncbi:MAG: phosphomannomutase [Rhizobiaceae bacterium]
MDVKFGTSGLRGLADELLDRVAGVYTNAFCEYCRGYIQYEDKSPIFVARDLRESSPQITSVVLEEIHERGFEPVDCGAVPTPALAYFAMSRNAPSIMVTGSHIPADRNGLKFYLPAGEIDKDDEIAITQLAEEQSGNVESRQIEPSSKSVQSIQAEVIDSFNFRYQNLLPAKALDGLSVGLWEHSSVAAPFLKKALESFGAKVVTFGRTEEFIPVDTEALSDGTRVLLEEMAVDHKLDAIISTDADGDRPLITDNSGRQIQGDLIGCITAEFLGAHAIATPVTSNSAIGRSSGFDVLRTRVGSPYVIAAMQQLADSHTPDGSRIVAGFEANGGFLLATDAHHCGKIVTALPTRDSVLPILAVLSRIAADGTDRLKHDFGFKHVFAGRIEDFPQDKSAALMAWLGESRENLKKFMESHGGLAEVDLTDGFRISTLDNRIVHLRPSGNAPEMRIYCEAESVEAARILFDKVRTETSNFQLG